MKKFLQKKLKDQKGMTLIELLAVIVIIAIIAAIAIPAISNLIQNSREDALVADAQNVLSAASLYFAENGGATAFADDTPNVNNYIETTGEITDFNVTKGTPNSITFTGTAGSESFTVTATKEQLDAGRSVLGSATTPAGDGS
ncbi:hypothetical protein BBI15_02690 [Planococcus plakortidis]|uniref:Tfp assembly type protein n=1 Tax=Planococcus plakortidis TaxID=1038856 RepID=A0A1C7E5R9_9BACL|nr:prepilin-type N-terminal cleavage/methylation domain-containing protein [Planococcus plakortidis]ANU19190.1 hypothetical protein BBI15_02690 [Planococcus plakortidis]